MALKWTRRAILKILGFMDTTSLAIGVYKYMEGNSRILLPELIKDGTSRWKGLLFQ